MEIVLVRHAESLANTGDRLPHIHGDYHIGLTSRGFAQCSDLSRSIFSSELTEAMVYCSPFNRALETCYTLINEYGLEDVVVREDPLLREQDRGYESEESQMELRRTHGWFYYRHSGGESPADVYQRVSVFIDSMYREIARTGQEKVLIFSHGMTIRCFVARFMHLSVDDFLRMKNPKNCDVIRISSADDSIDSNFVSGRWAVNGLSLRPDLDGLLKGKGKGRALSLHEIDNLTRKIKELSKDG